MWLRIPHIFFDWFPLMWRCIHSLYIVLLQKGGTIWCFSCHHVTGLMPRLRTTGVRQVGWAAVTNYGKKCMEAADSEMIKWLYQFLSPPAKPEHFLSSKTTVSINNGEPQDPRGISSSNPPGLGRDYQRCVNNCWTQPCKMTRTHHVKLQVESINWKPERFGS